MFEGKVLVISVINQLLKATTLFLEIIMQSGLQGQSLWSRPQYIYQYALCIYFYKQWFVTINYNDQEGPINVENTKECYKYFTNDLPCAI